MILLGVTVLNFRHETCGYEGERFPPLSLLIDNAAEQKLTNESGLLLVQLP